MEIASSRPDILGRPVFPALWRLVAATFPLFAVEFLRLNDEQVLRVSFAVPMVLLVVILGAGIVVAMAECGSILRPGAGSSPVLLHGSMVLFFAWHLLSLIRAEDFKWGLRETVKLAMGIGAYWIVVTFFPRDRRLLERFWRIALWATAALMAYLIHVYAFVFAVPYLGNCIDQPTRAGRNMLTWYIVFILPYAVTGFMDSRRKVLDGVPLLVLVVAWIYAGSRGAWVSVAGGLAAMLALLVRADPRRGARITLALLAVLAVVLGAAGWLMSAYFSAEELEYGRRFLALIDPDAVPESASSAERLDLMEKALGQFVGVPLTGLGLMNFTMTSDLVTHNDYLAILVDMGLVGFALFAGILALSTRRLFRHGRRLDWICLGGRASMVGVIISFFFINAYTNMIFWIFLGLALVAADTEESSGVGEPFPGELPGSPATADGRAR